MSVGEYCNREVIVTDKDTSAQEAARLMREYHVGDLLVVEEIGGERVPLGVVTDRDLVVEILAPAVDAEAVAVKDLITRGIATVREDADLWDTLSHMRSLGIRRMPVINDRGGLEGIFTLDDALELISEQVNDLVKLVKREVQREARERGPLPQVEEPEG
mgnify:CR=1 FL=1